MTVDRVGMVRLVGLLIFVAVVSGFFPASFAIGEALAARTEVQPSSFRLQPGNRLEITVYREEDLSGVYEVDPSGNLMFPLVGELRAADLEMEEFRSQLILKLKKYLVNPQVSIARAEGAIKSISVLGHVTRPGTYDYIPGSTLMRLISTAEGFAESANKRKIRIVRVVDGEKKIIFVNAFDVIDGKTDDPEIESGDIIFVPESVF